MYITTHSLGLKGHLQKAGVQVPLKVDPLPLGAGANAKVFAGECVVSAAFMCRFCCLAW
jgi:hypothetical protein